MTSNIRTFIAIELDQQVKDTLHEIQSHFKKLDLDVKWVKLENIHLTLKFLGNIPPKKLKSVLETFPLLLTECTSFEINITHLGVFPRSCPRIAILNENERANGLTRPQDKNARMRSKTTSRTFLSENAVSPLHSRSQLNRNLGTASNPQQPRIIWAGVDKNADQLINLATLVENGLCKLGFKKEKRGFSPHITIGRIKSNKNISLLTQAINEYSFPAGINQIIKQVVLFKSTLTPQGPIYEPLNMVQL